ncbi:MAG: HAD-IIIA family hydrolase [Bdellovibrionales bacterium]
MRPPAVMILAGGKGTRLSSIVSDVPKPMASISGRPFLEYQIDFLKRQGFDRFILLTGHLSGSIKDHFGDGRDFGVSIEYSEEVEPLGTGGAISQALACRDHSEVLVLNGDSLFTMDYRRFCLLAHGVATLALYFSHDLARFGSVSLSDQNQIAEFKEKSPSNACGYINAGVYHLRRDILGLLPQGRSSIEKDVFEPVAREGLLTGIPCGGRFIDIGTPDSYLWAQDQLPSWISQVPRPCLFLDRDGVLIRHKPYLSQPEEIEILAGSIELIHWARTMGYWVVVVSNQAGVGRGYFRETDCERVNASIRDRLRDASLTIDLWLSCYDHPDRATLRRKPEPGLLLEACETLPIDLSKSIMVGDNLTDQIRLPDMESILVQGDFDLTGADPGTIVARDLNEVLSILKHRKARLGAPYDAPTI